MERVRQADVDPALRATVAYCAALWRKHDHSHSAGEPIVKIDVHNHVLPKVSLELLRSDSRYGATVTETHEPSHPGEVDREIPAPQSARDHPPLQGDREQLVQGPHDGHGDPAEHRQVGEGEDPGIVEPGHQL